MKSNSDNIFWENVSWMGGLSGLNPAIPYNNFLIKSILCQSTYRPENPQHTNFHWNRAGSTYKRFFMNLFRLIFPRNLQSSIHIICYIQVYMSPRWLIITTFSWYCEISTSVKRKSTRAFCNAIYFGWYIRLTYFDGVWINRMCKCFLSRSSKSSDCSLFIL